MWSPTRNSVNDLYKIPKCEDIVSFADDTAVFWRAKLGKTKNPKREIFYTSFSIAK